MTTNQSTSPLVRLQRITRLKFGKRGLFIWVDNHLETLRGPQKYVSMMKYYQATNPRPFFCVGGESSMVYVLIYFDKYGSRKIQQRRRTVSQPPPNTDITESLITAPLLRAKSCPTLSRTTEHTPGPEDAGDTVSRAGSGPRLGDPLLAVSGGALKQ